MIDIGDEAVDLAAELVRIDSANPGLVPGSAGERAIVEHLSHRLERSGFTVTVVAAQGRADRPSLVARPRRSPASGEPTIILNGHLDTVGVGGMAAPFAARIEDDRLLGRGAADMKGGVAALVVAAERLVAAGVPVRPVLALVADEEDASLGSEAAIDLLAGLGVHPDAALIAEPTDLALARTLRGFAVVHLRFAGRAAHSSQPELGISAVSHLGRFLAAVDGRAADIRATGGELMVSVVRGGDSPFLVPAHAECTVERRMPPGHRAAAALDEIRSLLPAEAEATVELLGHREPWRLDDSGPAAYLAARLGVALGTGPTFDAPYWMEAPLWQAVCPTVVCGPSGGGLHADGEWLDLRQLRAFARALVTTLGTWKPDGD